MLSFSTSSSQHHSDEVSPGNELHLAVQRNEKRSTVFDVGKQTYRYGMVYYVAGPENQMVLGVPLYNLFREPLVEPVVTGLIVRSNRRQEDILVRREVKE
jgi:hypothetical protein